jgi:hypothetical protein
MILPDFLEHPLCLKVADKIKECAATPEFAAALDDGADDKQKKINAKLRKAVAKWAESRYLCKDFWALSEYDYSGFLDEPSVFQAPNALDSCATIGAAVKAGGGLVGNK